MLQFAKHAESFEFDPEFVNAVLASFFVDDFIGGETNEERAFDLFKKLQLRFADGHFWFRKWRTNNAELRKRLSANTTSNANGKDFRNHLGRYTRQIRIRS